MKPSGSPPVEVGATVGSVLVRSSLGTDADVLARCREEAHVRDCRGPQFC